LEVGPSIGPQVEARASKGDVVDVGLHLGDVSQIDLATGDAGLAELASLPPVDVHPLARLLFDRGVSITSASRMLGCSRWTLQDWLARRTRPTWWRGQEIARGLGFDDPDELFPLARDRSGG